MIELTCRSENPALKQPQKASIRLEVRYAPEVTIALDRTTITEGDDLRFTCTASANPGGDIVYKWYKNDEVIMGDATTQLILLKVGRDMNGAVIACEASNAVGTRRAQHTLSVLFGPVFRTPLPAVHGADRGESVKLTCDVDGNPTPDITWMNEKSPRVLSNEAELTLADMTYEMAGSYLCRASVRGFSEIVASTQVFIKGSYCSINPHSSRTRHRLLYTLYIVVHCTAIVVRDDCVASGGSPVFRDYRRCASSERHCSVRARLCAAACVCVVTKASVSHCCS